MEAYIKLSTIWSSDRCLRPDALTSIKNQFVLFTRWYQELAGFNFKKNSNADALSRSCHMAEAPPLEEDEFAKFYRIDKPVIKFEGEVNEIQHIQWSLIEIA